MNRRQSVLTTGISRISRKTEVEEREVVEVSYGVFVTSWQTRLTWSPQLRLISRKRQKCGFEIFSMSFTSVSKYILIVYSLKVSTWLVGIRGQVSHSGIPTKPKKKKTSMETSSMWEQLKNLDLSYMNCSSQCISTETQWISCGLWTARLGEQRRGYGISPTRHW